MAIWKPVTLTKNTPERRQVTGYRCKVCGIEMVAV
jgi:hypothetical protein